MARKNEQTGTSEAQPAAPKRETVTIKAPNMHVAVFDLVGEAPYVCNRFNKKIETQMAEKQAAGSTTKKGAKREARDFDANYAGAFYRSEDGWFGLPASTFRNAAISACRTVGFAMTRAKLSIFVEADGVDTEDRTPLVRIHGEPERWQTYARNANGVCDIRVRPMWRQWTMRVRMRYDADQFTLADVTNLMMRVGVQVGIGEGRPDSRNSPGLGFGLFRLANASDGAKAVAG